ncbi:MAG: type II toxin-antitoxin system RelE/ParE family toxin [Candidatus Contendobacter sp.]|jgi:proteic killer suppression protein|nr:type II toxin-antitoxin system RelE/ParE family toxin [Candidatus Contendobacter sp.]
MIKTFANKETAAVFARQGVRRFGTDWLPVAQRKLAQLHQAQVIDDLRVPPGNRLEKLSGDRVGQHSIRINDQWRICFEWRDGNAWAVEMVDYH